MSDRPKTVVFDIGNVLIRWDPRNLYRKLFLERSDEMEWFLANVCTEAWNIEQDRGRSFADATALLRAQHPEHLHPLISAYDERWHEMLAGDIAGSVAVLEALHASGTPLYALTNWNQDKFRSARELFPFLARFRGIVVSGDERLIKPDPVFYRVLLERYGLDAADCVFIDDSPKNVRTAEQLGMHALRFESPDKLASELRALGFGV